MGCCMSCFEPPIIPESVPVIQINPAGLGSIRLTEGHNAVVQDHSAYVYHEIKSHKEPYLSTIIEEEYVKPVVFQEPIIVKEPVTHQEPQHQHQHQQQHKKKKHRK